MKFIFDLMVGTMKIRDCQESVSPLLCSERIAAAGIELLVLIIVNNSL